MKKAKIFVNNVFAGILEKLPLGKYRFSYAEDYISSPVSLTMPIQNRIYEFKQFPPFFEGLLPEGILLQALLRKYKLDKDDYLGQLISVGADVAGAITIKEMA